MGEKNFALDIVSVFWNTLLVFASYGCFVFIFPAVSFFFRLVLLFCVLEHACLTYYITLFK